MTGRDKFYVANNTTGRDKSDMANNMTSRVSLKRLRLSVWQKQAIVYNRRLKKKLNEDDTIPEITPDVKIPEGLFTKKASEIVAGLKALKNGAKEALTRITFYINRAGKNLSNKTEVLKAK